MRKLLDRGELLLVADDLTGACDVGAEFLRTGHRVRACVSPAPAPRDAEGFLSINTQSRGLSADQAAASMRRVLAGAPREARVVMKKIDTALRGNVASELEAAVDQFGAPAALVVPAIPWLGRTTIGGVQQFDGVPVHLTASARDPSSPSTQSDLVALLADTSLRPGLIPIESVRSGRAGEEAARMAEAGHRAVVVDAESDAQLDQIAADVLGCFQRVIFAGSLGIARAISKLVEPRSRSEALFELPAGAAIVFVGSAHPASVEQVKRAADCGLADVVYVSLARDGRCEIEARLLDRAVEALSSANAVVVAPPRDWDTEAGAAARIITGLRTLADGVLRRRDIAGIGLVGGECAFVLASALGAEFIELSHEISALVHAGRIIGGRLDGSRAAVKSGSVGGPEAITDMLRFLTGGNRR